MKHIGLVVLVFSLAILSVHCSDPVEPVVSQNLITNGEFEVGADSSLAGWEWVTGEVTFSNDVPPGDGQYSVRLRAFEIRTGDIRTKVPALPGTHIYRLTAWGRMDPGTTAGASAWMALLRGNESFHDIKVSFPETEWTSKSVGISIVAQPGDSIGVTLRAIYGPNAQGYSYFDRVQLEVDPAH